MAKNLSMLISADDSTELEMRFGPYIIGASGSKGDKGDQGPAGSLNDGDAATLQTASTNAASAQSTLSAIAGGTNTDAGTLTGADVLPLSRAGLLQTTLTKIAQWVIGTYQGFTQSGAGAVARAILAKLLDAHITPQDFGAKGDGTTDDTAACIAVVARAVASGKRIHWPVGTYLTTAAIPNLHSVSHSGAGSILRNGKTFYVSPLAANSNVLYVSVAGVATNDGLSLTEPMTIQAALTALANYGPVLLGKWTVQLDAGTYTTLNNLVPVGLRSNRLITIQGPDVGGYPNVPTAIIQGTGVAGNDGIDARRNAHLEVKDILFVNVDSPVAVAERSLLSCRNVHQTNCIQGILAYDNCQLFVSGGVHQWTGSYAGIAMIQSMFNNKHHIGWYYDDVSGFAVADASIALAPLLTSAVVSQTGMLLQENSTGHVFAKVVGFAYGIDIHASSRANLSSGSNWATVYKCGTGIRVGHGCNIYEAGVDFGVGTANRNLNSAISFVSGADYGTQHNNASLEYKVAEYIGPATVTGTTSETSVGGTLYTLPAFALYKTGEIRLRVVGSITGTAGTKQLRMRFGANSAAFLTFTAASSGSFVADIALKALGVNSQVVWATGICGAVAASFTTTNGLVGLGDSSSNAVTLNVTNASAADSTVVNYIEVYRRG